MQSQRSEGDREMQARTVEGGCLCGAIRFEIALPTSFCVHCHCTMCRRAHGAGFVTWIGVPVAQFKLLSGAEARVDYRSSDHGTRSFCRSCGSTLFCRSSRHPEQIDIVLANLEGPIDRAPQAHTYFDAHVDWVPLDDTLPRMREDELPS